VRSTPRQLVVALNPATTRLAFTVQPTTTLPFLTIKPTVQVTAVDDQGNPLTGFTGAVTIAIGHNGGMILPGTLSGTRTVVAVNGVATFSDLSIDQIGNGYTLVVSAPGLAGAESATFGGLPRDRVLGVRRLGGLHRCRLGDAHDRGSKQVQ